jgi:UDP-N-acetylglucosamine diphosphorylase / glucose-1-phosphate thymidylyltransferase / UDP-N-acetylgalactosamine diphosphorylase / glucosamine-1-phosphate N-acetyltransferase / galactosamine-1-phosphate N-acetyltransferase
MQIIIFEDEKVSLLKPLVNLKPVYGMVSGFRSLDEKFQHHIGSRHQLSYHLRRYLAPFFREQHPDRIVNSIVEDDVLFVNGRLICDKRLAAIVAGGGVEPGHVFMQDDDLVLARTARSRLQRDSDELLADVVDTAELSSGLALENVSGFRMIRHVWDAIGFHAAELQHDSEILELGSLEGDVHPSAVIVNPSNVYIGPEAVVKAGAVIDATEGFVAVGCGAVVEPQAVLMNSVFLAPWSKVNIGAKIYSNVAVGIASKVGGEVEDSIIEPFANKQHDGFLGHSYLSSWCNLGAGTNTSDLKNNYSKIALDMGDHKVLTDLQFLGLIMGDHSKSSINSMFNTGTIVGTSANVFGEGFPPKYIPSFSWAGSARGIEPYDLDKAVETARKVMERRRVFMSRSYEAMFRFLALREQGREVFI